MKNFILRNFVILNNYGNEKPLASEEFLKNSLLSYFKFSKNLPDPNPHYYMLSHALSSRKHLQKIGCGFIRKREGFVHAIQSVEKSTLLNCVRYVQYWWLTVVVRGEKKEFSQRFNILLGKSFLFYRFLKKLIDTLSKVHEKGCGSFFWTSKGFRWLLFSYVRNSVCETLVQLQSPFFLKLKCAIEVYLKLCVLNFCDDLLNCSWVILKEC